MDSRREADQDRAAANAFAKAFRANTGEPLVLPAAVVRRMSDGGYDLSNAVVSQPIPTDALSQLRAWS